MVYRTGRQQNTTHSRDYLTAGEPVGYWNTSGNQLNWYQMVYWVLFTIGNELATCIMVLYFLLIYRGDEIDGVDANTHLTNGLLSLVDLWISGLPVNFLHFVYIVTFSVVYSIFSGAYFLSTGENIYDVLDYRSAPGAAVGLYLSLTFLLLPLLHSVVYFMYLGREWVVYRVCALRQAKKFSVSDYEEVGNSLELTELDNTLANNSNDSDNTV